MAIGRISGPMLFSNLDRQGVDLAFESNLLYLDVTNRRVGVSTTRPQYNFDSSGNVKLANIIILGDTITSNTGKINLGSTTNVVITGGSANFVLYTDGAGNLQWGNIANIAPTFSNINSVTGSFTTLSSTNLSTGNAVISGGYISTLTNAYINTSSITNFSTGNAVISGGYISALSNITVVTGNAEIWYATQVNSTNGNITTLVTTNFSTGNAQISGGNVTANITGNVIGTFANFSGNVTAPWFIGNVDGQIGNYTTSIIAANSSITSTAVQLQDVQIIGNAIRSTSTGLVISANTSNPNNIIRFDSVSAFSIPTGTTAQRPPNPVYGYLRFNTDLATLEWWSGVKWVAGASPITNQTITPDGVSSTFTLDQITTENGIFVNINGTVQHPGTAYTVAGDQITFAEVPQTTDIVDIRFISAGTTVSGGSGSGATIVDDTNTNADFYLTFANVTTGTPSTLEISTTKLTWNPFSSTLNVGLAASGAVIKAADLNSSGTGGQLVLRGGNANGGGTRSSITLGGVTNSSGAAGDISVISGVAGAGNGGHIYVTANDGGVLGATGGDVRLRAGASFGSSVPGGAINITGGLGSALYGTGGTVSVTGGEGGAAFDGFGGQGGPVYISGGRARATDPGGNVVITGGSSTSGVGGNVSITAGTTVGTGITGSISITGNTYVTGNVELSSTTGTPTNTTTPTSWLKIYVSGIAYFLPLYQ